MKLQWTPRAIADLGAIHDWIAGDNPPAATSVVAFIRRRAELLAAFPALGRATDAVDIRIAPIVRYPYLLYHRVAADDVVILHVRHTSRDAPEADALSS